MADKSTINDNEEDCMFDYTTGDGISHFQNLRDDFIFTMSAAELLKMETLNITRK